MTKLPPKALAGVVTVIFLAVNVATFTVPEKLSPCELEQVLSELVYPDEGYELQAAALRSQLRDRIQRNSADGYQDLSGEDTEAFYDKRSVSTLARDGALRNGKRNLAALARAGLLRDSDFIKRSIATLAKNGQLPSKEPETEDNNEEDDWVDQKRSLASLARGGYGNGKRNVQSLARNLPDGKRSITTLMRNGLYPIYETSPKRNLQALARSHLLFPAYGKRNVGKLARDWLLPNQQKSHPEKRETKDNSEKRNIGSLKNSPVHGSGSITTANSKQKREVSYSIMDETNPELAESNYQADPFEYDEMDDAYPLYYKSPAEKRYLGKQLPLMTVGKSRILPPTRPTPRISSRHGRL